MMKDPTVLPYDGVQENAAAPTYSSNIQVWLFGYHFAWIVSLVSVVVLQKKLDQQTLQYIFIAALLVCTSLAYIVYREFDTLKQKLQYASPPPVHVNGRVSPPAHQNTPEVEELGKALLNAPDIIVMSMHANGRIHTVSPYVERMLTYTADELEGKSLLHFVHTEDVSTIENLIQEVHVHPQPFNRHSMQAVPTTSLRFEFHTFDGSYIWLEGKWSKTTDSAPGSPDVVAVFHDVTSLENDKGAPQDGADASESPLMEQRSVEKSSNRKNSNGLSMSSFSSNTLSLKSHILSGSLSDVGKPLNTHTITSADWREIRHTMTNASHGTNVSSHPSARDENEKEDEKDADADFWETFLANTNTPIFGLSPDGKINHWNRRCAAITGYSKNEVCGKPFRDLVSPEYRAMAARMHREVIEGKKISDLEMTFVTKEGRSVDIILNVTIIAADKTDSQSAPGGVKGIVVLAHVHANQLGQQYRLLPTSALHLFRWVAGTGGAFGRVVLARKVQDNQVVAIKKIDTSGMQKHKEQDLAGEAKLLKSLEHPNIIKCIDYFFDSKEFHIVMEYADGGTIRERVINQREARDNMLAQQANGKAKTGENVGDRTMSFGKNVGDRTISFNRSNGSDSSERPDILQNYLDPIVIASQSVRNTLASSGRFPEEQVLGWFAQLVDAVRYLHERNIVHRDIKCMNVFLTSSNDIKLGDFGHATTVKDKGVQTACGTPETMSPEVIMGNVYGSKTDMWALGCVLYEMAMLERPFDGPTLHDLLMKVCRVDYQPLPKEFPADIRLLVTTLLVQHPDNRPTITEVAKFPSVEAALKSYNRKKTMAELQDGRKVTRIAGMQRKHSWSGTSMNSKQWNELGAVKAIQADKNNILRTEKIPRPMVMLDDEGN